MRYALDTSFAAALLAIVLATAAGVLTAVWPADAHPWVSPVVAGITAAAALIRRRFDAPEV